MTTTTVRPGQIWAHRQRTTRRITISATDERYAEVYSWYADSPLGGRAGRIVLDQIPRRFRLVSDAAS
jgi:uncharacterized protein involved in type VI secretion and phage assembly